MEPPLYKKIKGTTDDVTKWLTGKTTKKYGKNSSHAYHSIDTTEQYAVANDKQQKRVDEVKRFSQVYYMRCILIVLMQQSVHIQRYECSMADP